MAQMDWIGQTGPAVVGAAVLLSIVFNFLLKMRLNGFKDEVRNSVQRGITEREKDIGLELHSMTDRICAKFDHLTDKIERWLDESPRPPGDGTDST